MQSKRVSTLGRLCLAGFYERRKSRAATWCWRLAIISVPFFILTIFLHRSQSIATTQAFWLIAFGIAMVIGSLIFGLRAANDLWEKGYKGGRATVNGIALSTVLLIPFGIQLVNALEKPLLNDVATDLFSPPIYLTDVSTVSTSSDSSQVYDDYLSRRIVSSYPELVARRYTAPPERVVLSVIEILSRWNWVIEASENIPKVEVEEPANPDSDEDNGQEEANEQADDSELAGDVSEVERLRNAGGEIPDIIIQAKARSFILKLPSYLVIRLSAADETTLVDMRSSSSWGRHDFGSNADNIIQFLEALDASLAGLAGEG